MEKKMPDFLFYYRRPKNIARGACYLLLFVFCTWLALATRHHANWFPPFVAEYGGDTIWAGMFVFFLRIFFPRVTLWKLVIINYVLGALDEISQLYQAPWIIALRHTRLGGLMLGFGFLWSDLLCYALGTAMGWMIAIGVDRLFRDSRKKRISARSIHHS